MHKINYVCPCWSGPRRGGDEFYNKDRSIYLRAQIATLNLLQHHLSQITFVVPKNTEEPVQFRDLIDNIPEKIGETPIKIIETKNTHSSYGPYHYVYSLYKETFDYYILIEDDYVFVKNNFDDILVKIMKKTKCGYLCGRIGKCGDGLPIASVSNGLVHSSAFKQIWDHFGCIPHAGQVEFSDAFLNSGVKMKDYGGTFRTPFYGFGSCAWFHASNEEDLIVPVQCYLNQENFREAFLPSSWPEWYNLALSFRNLYAPAHGI